MAAFRPVTLARRFWPRGAALAAAVCLGGAAALLLGLGASAPDARAYSNCAEPDFMTGGPHRTLNELALAHFFKNLPAGDVRAAYADDPNCTVRGTMCVGRTDLVQLIEDSRAATWREWVIQGGFSADEPEIYNSFRHFYDPLALNPNPRFPFSSQGVPYLTDHLDQIHTYLKLGLKDLLTPTLARDKLALELFGRWYADVQVDARDWAINGNKGQGYWENTYSWKKGIEYFRIAFTGQENGKELSGVERDRRFAQAWRALGETMHLLADMCCPPHVRNDSHPGRSLGAMSYDAIGISPGSDSHDPNVGVLKNDPYELWCDEALIRQCGERSAPDNVATTLRATGTPEELFKVVATFTNRSFFSADTVPFRVLGNPNLQMANGCKPYPLPDLDALAPVHGYYVADIWGQPVKLCHKSWLTAAGWGGDIHARRITYPCVQEQAQILVPLAKSALAVLADWFVPKLELVFDRYDPNSKKLTLKLRHTPYGAFPDPLLYTDSQPTCRLFFDTYIQNSDLYTASAEQGKLRLDLSRLPVKPDTRAAVELDLGGLRLRSADARLDAPAAKRNIVWRLKQVRTRTWRDMQEPEDVKSSSLRDTIGAGTYTCSWTSSSKPPASGSVTATWTEPPKVIRPGEVLTFGIGASATHSKSKDYACGISVITPNWGVTPPRGNGPGDYDRIAHTSCQGVSGSGPGKASLRLVPVKPVVSGGAVQLSVSIWHFDKGSSYITDRANGLLDRVWEYESVEE